MLMDEALECGKVGRIAFYERPMIKKTRQAYAGQWNLATTMTNHIRPYLAKNYPKLAMLPIQYVGHHQSHAATGALTSPYDEACVVVIDAIGEWDCVTIWKYKAPCNFVKLRSFKYPNSLGLFYTAMTTRVGLKANEDEYILMGMAAYGHPIYYEQMMDDFFHPGTCKLTMNLHRGCNKYLDDADPMDIAASAQMVIESKICDIIKHARTICNTDNLVYMGGCALNCVANTNLGRYFPNIWICPNPGDAGSSLGAADYTSCKGLDWSSPFLGHNILGDYPINEVMGELRNGNIVGVANGRAEFGPRALGNRSLLADPRGPHTKDQVNKIKRRQEFRPFAPAIMIEHAQSYFDMPVKASPYMQYTAKCKHPDKFPAIVHTDGTSRVQTVNKNDNPNFYNLINAFYKETGCPMLLNTSLNIKGLPMVNDFLDAMQFSREYGVKVCTHD